MTTIRYPKPTWADKIGRVCHGCRGKGWVEVGSYARRCPICGGEGKLPIKDESLPLMGSNG